MWDIPRYKIRSYVQSLRRSRGRNRLQPSQNLKVKRSLAQVRVTDGYATQNNFVPCPVILNDMTEEGMVIYSAVQFLPGQQIAIAMEQPRWFYVKARIMSCVKREVGSRVLSTNPSHYRITVIFEHETPAEGFAVSRYFEFLKQVLYGNKAVF